MWFNGPSIIKARVVDFFDRLCVGVDRNVMALYAIENPGRRVQQPSSEPARTVAVWLGCWEDLFARRWEIPTAARLSLLRARRRKMPSNMGQAKPQGCDLLLRVSSRVVPVAGPVAATPASVTAAKQYGSARPAHGQRPRTLSSRMRDCLQENTTDALGIVRATSQVVSPLLRIPLGVCVHL